MSEEKPANPQHADHHEAGVEVPYERINPETLRNMIQEFVTRDGADWGDAGCSLDDKYQQVLQQLRTRRVKVVFDLTAQTANIVVCR
ncbi:MAG: YheU family protein [Desulfuromonadales bacterium]|nr:YheU family protein [Desulfuromonadales bacterium]